MKQFFTTTLFLCITLSMQAQKITIDLPRFADREYVWLMCNGEKQDTITYGALDTKGQAVLTIPPAYKNWRGMSNFMLAEGGGFEIIINGEKDFTAGCAVAAPTINDIYYTGSEENSFFLRQYIQQQRLLGKAGAIIAATREYTQQEPIYKVLSNEKESLEKQFVELQSQLNKSPLLAARIRQMSNFLNGIGSRLDLTEQEFIEEQRQYIREVLDFNQLRTSGLWKNVLTRWISLEASQGDSVLLADSKAILAREQNRDMREVLLKKMVSLYHQYGKENLLSNFGIEDLLSPGHKAPELYLPNSTSFVPLNSLVIFYESGCGNCENELTQIRNNYSVLQEKNLNVISVSADNSEEIFKKNADTFPWQQKLCDYTGFDGVNFKNYAIVGTPTIYIINDKGTITGRYARLADFFQIGK